MDIFLMLWDTSVISGWCVYYVNTLCSKKFSEILKMQTSLTSLPTENFKKNGKLLHDGMKFGTQVSFCPLSQAILHLKAQPPKKCL